jgi:hypothetical protein
VAKSKQCLISVELAYVLRDVAAAAEVSAAAQGFRCVACRFPVKPVSLASGETFFEHLEPNPNCSLSYEAVKGQPASIVP